MDLIVPRHLKQTPAADSDLERCLSLALRLCRGAHEKRSMREITVKVRECVSTTYFDSELSPSSQADANVTVCPVHTS